MPLYYLLIIPLLVITMSTSQAQSNHSPILKSEQITVNQSTFDVLTIKTSAIQLHWKNPDFSNHKNNNQSTNTTPRFSYFNQLNNYLRKHQKQVFALMNAGIYSNNLKPSGLHIEKGKLLKTINTKNGKGNFHLPPNGVFYITKKNTANILSTQPFKKKFKPPYPKIRLATQSGPMLVINHKINPILKPNSQSLYTRNGICIDTKSQVKWIASQHAFGNANPSNLYTFAKAMKLLGCKQGLYLDGSISKLYQKDKGYFFHFRPFVGILSATLDLPQASN